MPMKSEKRERNEPLRDEPLCSGCGFEPRLPNQRYGRRCHNDAQKKYRLKRRNELALLRELAKRKGE
jgi:hypothetical protein